jgi:lysophospholipid acyltransferase (LPLAT)-like uncharacterized protein
VPIVPLRFDRLRYWQASGWDGKRFPQPFSTIRVTFGRPIIVDEQRFQAAARETA